MDNLTKDHGRFRWTLGAFSASGLLMMLLLAWQLFETTPARWCALAANGSPELTTGCATILLRLLEIKDHVSIGLMAITGLSVLALAVVATGTKINASGAGFNADIGADKTTVSTDDGTSTLTIPTPPASDVQ